MPPVVVLCQPLYGVVPPLAHANLMEFQGTNMARGFLHGYRSRVGAYIDTARNEIADWVVGQTPATHLLFVDQDMILPMDTLKCLLEDDKECVSATYFGKDDRATLVAWESLNPSKRLQDFDSERVQEVAGVGMGACLIRTDVFRAMAQKYGDREWFRSERGGEDYHFCRRLAEMDVPVWLDGRLQCGHVGDTLITVEHWKQGRPEIPQSEAA